MTQKNNLFEDNLRITEVNKDGKVFDKVSRVEGITDDSLCKVLLDVNSDVYPIPKDSYYQMLITKSLNADGSPSPNTFSFDMYSKKNSLIDKFDYVTYGKIFKYSEDPSGKVSVYASFGGLLLGITGSPSQLANLTMDERIYLLLKKID